MPQNLDKLEIHVHGACESVYMTVLCSLWNETDYHFDACRIVDKAHPAIQQVTIRVNRLALHALQISLLHRPYFCYDITDRQTKFIYQNFLIFFTYYEGAQLIFFMILK